MARLVRLALAVVALLAAVLPAARADLDVIRDPAELQARFSDKTVYGRFPSGDNFREYHAPDGRTAYFQLQCLHAGTWWVTRLLHDFGQIAAGTPIICYDYPTLNDKADPSCFAVGGPAGRERFFPIGGNPDFTGIPSATVERLLPGNPDNLALDQEGCPGV